MGPIEESLFMSDRLKGVHTIVPTPFGERGELDGESLFTLIDFLVKLGVDGVVVLGVMGEAPKLSEDEQAEVIRVAVAAAAGRIPVFAGAGAAGTDLAVAKGLAALKGGAAGLLVAPPPVQKDAVIFEYYRRLGEAVQAPLILHDYPATTGILLSAELVARLFDEIDQVRVIKLEEPPTGPKIARLRGLCPELSILGGLGGMYLLEELQRGADGIMTGFSFPEILLAIYRAHTRGDLEAARRIFYGACALLRYEFQPGIGLAVRKEIYRRRGAIRTAFVRHPGAQIDGELRRELAQVLDFCPPEALLKAL
jgi:4-hydroxy-tetrahydrodipicolinate synthase